MKNQEIKKPPAEDNTVMMKMAKPVLKQIVQALVRLLMKLLHWPQDVKRVQVICKSYCI